MSETNREALGERTKKRLKELLRLDADRNWPILPLPSLLIYLKVAHTQLIDKNTRTQSYLATFFNIHSIAPWVPQYSIQRPLITKLIPCHAEYATK